MGRENRGQKGQDHRNKKKEREVRRKRMVKARKRVGRVVVLIETRTKASGRRANTAERQRNERKERWPLKPKCDYGQGALVYSVI